ncbi:hypothetical protein [Thalassoglobus polymorphus]|nr:hypothetical protein [Thalassoglobus polymorphus]
MMISLKQTNGLHETRSIQSLIRLRSLVLSGLIFLSSIQTIHAEGLQAGAAKVDVTHRDAGPVNDTLYARALVIKSGETVAVIVSVDAVAIGEIGPIKNDYLPSVRKQLQSKLGIAPSNVMVNASHCHGIVVPDVADRTVQAVTQAIENLEPVRVGVGIGHEDRIQENRRLKLKSGKEADVRHAYSLPADEEVAEVGPIDPQIGILKLEREDGRTLAVVYNFACHPIQGVPGGANTADMTGYSSKVIEDNLSEGAIALFVQGCGGDINPIDYKDTDHPRHAEPLGNMLGLSTLQAVRKIECQEDNRLTVFNELLTLPRGDRAERIAQLEARQRQLVQSLGGTSLNLKTFLPLVMKYNLSDEFPSYYSHRYLHDDALDRKTLRHLDAENRRNIEAYIKNIHTMEELTRVNTNLRLLNKHQASMIASGKRTIDVEVGALRVGNFVLVTFPGELTVRIGLNIKKASPHQPTFVAGYTNGYIYYAPTAEQLMNVGGAQEDSDCILAPEWQEIFESKVAAMLKEL